MPLAQSVLVANSQVIAATNRPDVLDPALLRSGRLDRHSRVSNETDGHNAAIRQD